MTKTKSPVVERIDKLCALYNISKEEIALTMKMTLPTYYARRKRPEDFTLAELGRAADKIHTTIYALCGGTENARVSYIADGIKAIVEAV